MTPWQAHTETTRTAAVQFAKSRESGSEVAIKFFLEHEAFNTEQRLFQKSSLRSMMPAVSAIEPNSQVRRSPGECDLQAGCDSSDSYALKG
jgi:hypothetical protein